MLAPAIHLHATKGDYRAFVRSLRHAEARDLIAITPRKSYLLNSCIRGDLRRSLETDRFYPDFTRTYLSHLDNSLGDRALFERTLRRRVKGVTASEELTLLLRICQNEKEGVFRCLSTAQDLVDHYSK